MTPTFVKVAAPMESTRKPRACVPCHERKVRCDSAGVGTPCTRCVTKERTHECVLVTRPDKSESNKRKRGSDAAAAPTRSGALNGGSAGHAAGAASPPPTRDAGPAGLFCRGRDPLSYQHSVSSPRQPQAVPTPTPTAPSTPGIVPGQPRAAPASRRGTADGSQSGGARAHVQYSMSDEDAHLQTLCRMSDRETVALTPPSTGSQAVHRVFEYYSDFNALALLGDTLGQPARRRLVHVDLPTPQTTSVLDRELSRLDEVDRLYLKQRRVHELPPRHASDELMLLFFKHVYPYTPVVDRVQVATDYQQSTCSTFLLYTIFAITIPYAGRELIQAAGFESVTHGQREFFTRARVLYDFGCEKAQLNLLQGSVFMSSFQNSFAPDKDFRFWFSNAVRIATQMGLHRQNLERDLNPTMHRMGRRIWWLLFQRDVMFSLAGFENVRRLNDEEADARPLVAEDWKEESMTERARAIISPVTDIQVQFAIENCKLAQLGARFLRLFRSVGTVPSMSQVRDLGDAIGRWRSSLPPPLRMDGVIRWDSSNVWIIVILVFSFRLECLFYQTLRRRANLLDPADGAWVDQRFQGSMFELSTLLRRAMAHNVLHTGPPSLVVCTTQLMALQIETALSPKSTRTQRMSLKADIHTVLSYMWEIEDTWLNAKWASRVFDWVVKRSGLSLNETETSNSEGTRRSSWPNDAENGRQRDVGLPQNEQTDFVGDMNAQLGEFEILPDNWLQDMIDQGLVDGQDQTMFGIFGAPF